MSRFISSPSPMVMVDVIYKLSSAMLVFFFYSYIVQIELRLFQHFIKHGIARLLDFLLTVAISIFCVAGAMALIDHVAGLIVTAKAI